MQCFLSPAGEGAERIAKGGLHKVSYEAIILKKENRIATITLNRPERLNAINRTLVSELGAAINEVAHDESVRVLVLSGAGRAFCAGGDFRYGDVRSGAEGEAPIDFDDVLGGQLLTGPVSGGVLLGLRKLEIPTIAMINGPAVGGGFDMALACDVRIGSEKAKFGVAYTKIGLNPAAGGGGWVLPRIIGLGRTLDLLYSGDVLDAQEAFRIGLLNKLVSAENLEKETMSYAARLAAGPPISLRLAKLQTYKAFAMDYESAVALGGTCEYLCILSDDHKEGVKAFAEKRPPVFKGK
jgi:enoyl-CoA hydratase/carnithine racemase